MLKAAIPQGSAVSPDEEEGKPWWESMPVLRMLLAKGTRVPLAPWHWKKRRRKKGCQQYKGMTMDASWLVLVLNIDLQFETWEGFIHWVLKKKKKTHTKPLPLQQWRENCCVETGQPQSQALARKGPGCGSKVCHRAPKPHLIDFHLLVKIQKIHKYHRKIPESTPAIKACSHLTQFLKMPHFFPSENTRQEAHGQASFSAFTLKRIMPFYSQGGKKKHPGKSNSTTLSHAFHKACFQIFVMPRRMPKRHTRWAYECCVWLQHQPQCPGPVKWSRNPTPTQNCRIYFSAASWLKNIKVDLYAHCSLL